MLALNYPTQNYICIICCNHVNWYCYSSTSCFFSYYVIIIMWPSCDHHYILLYWKKKKKRNIKSKKIRKLKIENNYRSLEYTMTITLYLAHYFPYISFSYQPESHIFFVFVLLFPCWSYFILKNISLIPYGI